ncbi:MAG: efflux RND transporter periplasmic adaptor subunit [Thermoanaerobaculia bacterium]
MELIDRRRVVIPTAIVATLILVTAIVVYFKSGSAKVPVGVTKSAAAATTKDGKNGTNGKEKAPVPVSVSAVSVGAISSYISATANLVAENDVKIVAEAEGRVARLLVEEGVFVEKGAVLATLDRDDAEIALAKARVQSANAGVAYKRANEMVAKDLMSRSDHDKVSLDKDVAQQVQAEAEWRLSKTTIRAPFAGRVTERMINVGQHVRPGETLFSVADFDPLVARIYLAERDVIDLREGQAVRIRLKSADEVEFAGRIRQISPVVDTATGTVKVTVEAVKPPDVVRPGGFVTVDIVRDTREKAMLVPRTAVIRELRDAHVFVAEKGVARKRAVHLGIEEGETIEVLGGVKAGEQVIVTGQGSLKEGSPVKILPAARG